MFSIHELFRIGLGPSSSHTIGPMIAAGRFMEGVSFEPTQLTATLYGSLALTGRGHATDKAVLLGLAGYLPSDIDPNHADQLFIEFASQKHIVMQNGAVVPVAVVFESDTFLAEHPNGVTFVATDDASNRHSETWFSIGGGAIKSSDDFKAVPQEHKNSEFKYRFCSGDTLISCAKENNKSIAELIFENEVQIQSVEPAAVNAQIDEIWRVMYDCIDRGCQQSGELPGGLGIKRRAQPLYESLQNRPMSRDPLSAIDWVSLFALAVNEENAAGGRVVTAPTNGAAGVIPAVLGFLVRFEGFGKNKIREFLLTTAAIGMLYKENASISAAEVGCQGEIGVASSMAAAGYAAVMGGTPEQIENAAEIAMEHHLGMTCDPIGGLVQVPCIERNTMGAIKAINAARLALNGDGHHRVSLDSVIATMLETGRDMERKYKETALGGLAVNVVIC